MSRTRTLPTVPESGIGSTVRTALKAGMSKALVTVDPDCCPGSAFTAYSEAQARALHAEYHNDQAGRGRRTYRVELSPSQVTYNVIIFHAHSELPTLAASMITWDEAQSLQSALINLAEQGLIDALGVSVVRVRD